MRQHRINTDLTDAGAVPHSDAVAIALTKACAGSGSDADADPDPDPQSNTQPVAFAYYQLSWLLEVIRQKCSYEEERHE